MLPWLQEFNTADLKRGMVALIRTEPDNTQEWDKPWSLGRLLKIYPIRKKVDVLWLKPAAGVGPHKRCCSPLVALTLVLLSMCRITSWSVICVSSNDLYSACL